MAQHQWHLLTNTVIFLIALLLKPDIGIFPLFFLLLADVTLDIDHLIKFKSLKEILRQYYTCKEYPFHKVWIIFPVAGLSLFTPVFWFGIGLLTHFTLDFIENHLIFNGKFRWV